MELTVSPAPHIHDNLTVSKCMYNVIIALLPAFAVSLYFFGIGALIVTLSSILSCVIVEYLIQKYLLKEKPSIGNGSAILTGLLLAFNLPSNLPIWIVVIGSIVAIGIAKMSFGGLGNNLFNPALAGRVFLLISFPTQMTQWPLPIVSRWNYTDAETPYTRIIEHKHFEFGTQPKTVISREYSAEWKKGDEPYYPVNDEKNGALYAEYKKLADAEPDVIFGGRLGEYKYYDMDKVIEVALDVAAKELK